MEKGTASGKTQSIPESLRPFFWDVDFEELCVDDSSYFIISRLMEFGDEVALQFLMRTYSWEDFRRTIKTSRSLSRRSRIFWALLLDVKEESCTVKQYPSPFGDCCRD